MRRHLRGALGTTWGRKRGGPWGRHVLGLLLVFSLGFGPRTAVAQIALPEQNISSFTLVQGHPTVTAAGSRVFADWASYIEAPRVGVGYAYSLDAGGVWVHQVGFPIGANDYSVGPPTAACLTPSGLTHLATRAGPMQCFRGQGFSPIVWSAPVIAIQTFASGFDGYDITGIGCDPTLPYVYIATTESYGFVENASYILFTRSLDNGATWQSPVRVSSQNCLAPSLAVGASGELYVSYVDYTLGQVLLRRSLDHGATFEPPVVVANMLDNLGTRPFGWRIGTGVLSNRDYPYYRKTDLAPNFPALAVDRTSGPSRGSLYLTWAEYAAGTVSPATTGVGDAGNNDSFATSQRVPLDCDISGSVTDVHLRADLDSYVFDGVAGQTVWINGTASPDQWPYFLYWEMPDGSRPLADFGYLKSSDPAFGQTSPMILTLPRTGRYFLQVSSQVTANSYAIQLRTYTPSLSSVSRDMRDIVLVRSTDGGATWSGKVRVNHDAAGADQCMPNVAVDGGGSVYVAWYDRRGIPAGDSVNAYASVSSDGGQSFGPDLKLSSRPGAWFGPQEPQFNSYPGELIGDRIAVAAGDAYGLVAWTDMRNWPARSDIYAARIVNIPTAVNAVSDLSGEPVAEGVRLSWYVNDARAVAGLRVYRAAQGDGEVALGASDLVPTRDGRLDYLDTTAEPGMTYAYRLQVRSGGQTDWLGPITVQMPTRIASLAWRAAWPNPFARRTSVKLAVPHAAEGSVRVFDVQGKEVRTLSAGRFVAGERVLEWDGRDASGGLAAPGLYFLTAQVGGERTQLRVARVP